MPDSSLIKPAATAVLLKQTTEGLRVLMLQRNSRLAFAGGFWVFPGGGVEARDYENSDNDIITVVSNAVVRETKEEAGIAIDDIALTYFSHWTTPDIAPKRYATWFLMGALPEDRPIVVDNEEIKDYAWVDAKEMLHMHQSKKIELLPPTYITLYELSFFSSAEAAMTFFSKRTAPIFLPKVSVQDKTVVFLYEGDSGYATGDATLDAKKHRFYMDNNGGAYHCDLDFLS